MDLQGEKFIYSTLFVNIKWSIDEHVLERGVNGKLEKRGKATARVAKFDQRSPSGTSIDSMTSSVTTFIDDTRAEKMDR